MIVHILYHGQAFCGQPGLPKDWPADHRWVLPSDRKDATCQKCLRVLDEPNPPPDTAVPFSSKDREYQEPKPRTQPVPQEPDPKAETIELPHVPEDRHSKAKAGDLEFCLEWAKKIAAQFDVDVWVVEAGDGGVPVFRQHPYAIQMKADNYRNVHRVKPDGKVWNCEQWT